MPRLTRSVLAERDLFEIWRFGHERWGEERADRYLDQLEAVLKLLIDHPALGRSRDELQDGYRSLPVGQHVAFYALRGDGVHVVRVLHGSVDPSGALDA